MYLSLSLLPLEEVKRTLITLLCSRVFNLSSHQVPTLFAIYSSNENMSNKSYIIEGCKCTLYRFVFSVNCQTNFGCSTATGGVQPRLEISELQKNPKQFSLFIQALKKIMDHKYEFEGSDAVNWEKLGWYHIVAWSMLLNLFRPAGIHGMSYKPWRYGHEYLIKNRL